MKMSGQRNSGTKHASPTAFTPPQILTRWRGQEEASSVGALPQRSAFLSHTPLSPAASSVPPAGIRTEDWVG